MVARRLRVLPDSDRVEQALESQSAEDGFVDASWFCTLGQLVNACEPYRHAGRAPAPALRQLFLVGRYAPAIASASFGDSARSPELAAALTELVAHLKSQSATPDSLREAARQVTGSLSARALAIADVWEQVDREL